MAVSAAASPSENAARTASGSSFYAAMRILPKAQRDAMYEIYAFCRAVDDIADDPGPAAGRKEQLEQWRADVRALYAGEAPPSLAGLKTAIQTFDLRQEDFLSVIDGMEMDVGDPIQAPDMDKLDIYCDRVASAVGRLSVRVFGLEAEDGIALAHHLGRALQLTNILRDLDEDAAVGRLYLPGEALRKGGIDATDPVTVLSHPALAKACAFVAERARYHFREADQIMARCRRRSVRAPSIMGEAYKLILDALLRRGWAAPRQRVRIGKPQLIWILLRHAL